MGSRRSAESVLSELTPTSVGRSARLVSVLVGLLFVGMLLVGVRGWWAEDLTGPDYIEDAATAERLRPLRIVPINTDLPMGDTSPYRWLLSDGFRDSEADGAWVMAHTAKLIFEVESFDEPFQANLSLSPLVNDGTPERSVTVSSSAGSVTVALTEGGEVVRVPLDGGLDQVLTIFCPTLDSPRDLRLGDDVRDLCVKLFNVAILTEDRAIELAPLSD